MSPIAAKMMPESSSLASVTRVLVKCLVVVAETSDSRYPNSDTDFFIFQIMSTILGNLTFFRATGPIICHNMLKKMNHKDCGLSGMVKSSSLLSASSL